MKQLYFVFLFVFLLKLSLANLQTTLIIDAWEENGNIQLIKLDRDAPPKEYIVDIIPSNFAVGGERDLILIAEEGLSGSVVSAIMFDNILNLAAPTSLSGTLLIQYDGVDHSMKLNSEGLNNLNLKSGGGDRIRIRAECDIGAWITIKIHSGDQSSISSVKIDPHELKDYFFFFSDFKGNVDFTRVGAIELLLPFDEQLDIVIEDFDVMGELFTFVAPLEHYYIDYSNGCEAKEKTNTNIMYSTIQFSTESASSNIYPSFCIFVLSFLLFL